MEPRGHGRRHRRHRRPRRRPRPPPRHRARRTPPGARRRRGPDAPGAAELAADLGGLGAEVTLAACDVADPEAVDRLFAAVPAAHPVTAVVHTAGILDDGLVESLTGERLAAVLRPKADAVWHLHRATRDLDLAAFVVFSSLAAPPAPPARPTTRLATPSWTPWPACAATPGCPASPSAGVRGCPSTAA
ncbi:KR domain-containing protein [Actinomadura keratinilytica]